MTASTELPQLDSVVARVMHRVLDPTKRIDYVVLALVAVWPAVFAALIGAYESDPQNSPPYRGYGDSPEWMVYILGLPFALFMVRWAAGKLYPHAGARPPAKLPGVVELVTSDDGRKKTYDAMHAALFSPTNVWVALIGTVLFHIVDIWTVFLRYYPADSVPDGVEYGWSLIALATDDVGIGENLVLAAFAYPMQFALVLMLFWFVVFAFRHNLFFLNRVYQRRRVPAGRESDYIVIDIEDPNRCFGFRSANEVFNVQVVGLMAAGAGLLFSRFPTITDEQTEAVYNMLRNLLPFLPSEGSVSLRLTGLLPDFGQWSIAVVWAVALGIVSIPALVKLLPRLPFVGSATAQRNITGYLREFLPDTHWPFDNQPSKTEVDALAARFAENAFWPTGNNRAKTLFFSSSFVGFVILFPLKPLPGYTVEFVGAYALMLGLAFGTTIVALKAIEWSLGYVDSRLVKINTDSTTPIAGMDSGGVAIGERYRGNIFICYRRDDTSAYARLLRDTLEEHCYPERIFRDLETVSGGQDFAIAIEEAITAADVVVVLIGTRWLAPDDQGDVRISDPEDWVHLEISASLARSDLQVIPVLVGGAKMPDPDQLPDLLKALSRRNAIEMTDSRWDYDVGQLVRAMKDGTKGVT